MSWCVADARVLTTLARPPGPEGLPTAHGPIRNDGSATAQDAPPAKKSRMARRVSPMLQRAHRVNRTDAIGPRGGLAHGELTTYVEGIGSARGPTSPRARRCGDGGD